MDFRTLVIRGLRYYWRTNVAVVLGVATAAAVLAGALLVGGSVRSSLRRLALERIGNTGTVVQSGTLFREALAKPMSGVPMIVLEGLVVHQQSGRRARALPVYGVDDRFWQFHGKPALGLSGRDAAITRALAAELEAKEGDTLLLRIEKPSDIPAESLFGRKDESSPTIRLNAKAVTPFEFSLKPQQSSVKAVFVPLSRLQRDIGAAGRVNTLLLPPGGDDAAARLRAAASLEDLGIRLRAMPEAGAVQLDSSSGVLPPPVVTAATGAASDLGLKTLPAMTYLATSIKANGRELPYSLVAALPLEALGVANAGEDAIVPNEWSARDLGVKAGDTLVMEYMIWHDDGRLGNAKAEFRVAGIAPIRGLAADRDLAPEYPGITDASNVADWDPPFPMDLGKIRKKDEDYWDTYRTTPKVYLPLTRGQQLWKSRWGSLTTLRFAPASLKDEALDKALQEMRLKLKAALDPAANGLTAVPIRERNLEASRGATDFGEYFVYFSFFLMTSALLLAGLFFRLGVEQRYGEVGLLRATGFSPDRVLRLFLAEGLVLSVAGGLLGILGAIGYAALVLFGLSTWWVDAVGTRDLALDAGALPLAGGVLGAVLAALGAIWITLRGARSVSPRRLLAGGAEGEESGIGQRSRGRRVAKVAGAFALALLVLSTIEAIPAEAGFFGAGALLLIAALAFLRGALASSLSRTVTTLGQFAFRNAGHRPGRTVLSAALIASAAFLVVSVEAFRRGAEGDATDPKSGSGGYPLIAESVRPVYYNPNTAEARQTLNLPPAAEAMFAPFRLRPGDDASCLNLYQPQNPRILGAPPAFLASNRFSFAGRRQSWADLEKDQPDGAIPAMADANSLAYVLHRKVGEELTVGGARLRVVGALRDSVFQSELVISERHFLKAFPAWQGYRVFLIDAPPASVAKVAADLENALADHGMDVVSTQEKLAGFHRVENTYLSTFQTLGALGLLLGTVGLAAIVFRNVLERRRELALLTAAGYGREALSRLVLKENLLTLGAGLGAGVAAAALAIAPVLASRGAHFSALGLGGMLLAVLVTGVAAAWIATRLALRLPLLSGLRGA